MNHLTTQQNSNSEVFAIGSRVRYVKENKPFTNLIGTIVDSTGFDCWVVLFDESFTYQSEVRSDMACSEANLVIHLDESDGI
jgi:hypothetical protein